MEVKPGHKQTEVGVIPEDWDAEKLGNFVSLQRGHDLTWRDRRKGDVPVMGSAGQNGFHDTAIAKGPGVVLGRSGASFGQAHYCEKDFWPHNTALYVTDFRGNDPLFVFYLLKSIDFTRHNSGGAQQSLNRNFIYPIQVGVPRPPEQRAIAGALSNVDALIGTLESALAKKRDLKQAAMQQLLTGQKRLPGFHGEWEVKRLGQLGTTYGGITGKTKADFGQGSAQYITFLNVMNNVVIDTSQFEQVAVRPTENQNAALKGDLFFNGSSETPEEVGMCAVLLEEVSGVYLNSFCFGFRFHDDVLANGLYLAYFFRSGEGRKLLYSLAQGATRHNLSKAALMAIEFPLPSLPEQTAIAEVLSNMDAELAALTQRRDKTRALKQGMMQELLTGRTRLV